jgi:hypothetical protein
MDIYALFDSEAGLALSVLLAGLFFVSFECLSAFVLRVIRGRDNEQ